MALLDPRFKQGLTRRGTNARGSALTSPAAAMQTMLAKKPQQPPTWEAAQMWPMPPKPEDFPMYGPPAPQPAMQPPPPQPQQVPQPPPQQQGMASLLGMMQQRGPQRGGGVDPNMKAIMDAMTGARVHKGMDGRQLGMEGVDPNLKYMLYAMRGRRHKGMNGKDIY